MLEVKAFNCQYDSMGYMANLAVSKIKEGMPVLFITNKDTRWAFIDKIRHICDPDRIKGKLTTLQSDNLEMIYSYISESSDNCFIITDVIGPEFMIPVFGKNIFTPSHSVSSN